VKFRRGPLLFFPKVTMAAAAILDLLGAMGPPTKACSWCVLSVKISSWSAKWFSSHKDLIFLSFSLESPIPQNFSFLGGLTPKLYGHMIQNPQKALLWAERHVLSPHWSRSDAHCDLWPWQRKHNRKKDSGKLAIRPDHPRRRIKVKVCMPGGLQCV